MNDSPLSPAPQTTEIRPVARFRSPVEGKFGLPRQAGIAESLKGEIVLEKEWNSPEALRGLEGFDYIWLIWGFSLNRECKPGHLTVRPPRLGGNTRVGVFASRSPFRPNSLGLSSVKLHSIDPRRGVITVLGADLADGTPIYDIKPYIEYADSHPGVRSGFTDDSSWQRLEVIVPEQTASRLEALFSPEDLQALKEILAEDPRPRYRSDPQRIYGLRFGKREILFRVEGGTLTLTDIN